MCFPDYCGNTPYISSDCFCEVVEVMTHSTAYIAVSAIQPSRPVRSAFGVHVPTRQTPLQPALGPSLCRLQAPKQGRRTDPTNVGALVLSLMLPAISLSLRDARVLTEEKPARILSSRRREQHRRPEVNHLLFDPFAEAISHVSIRPVPASSPSACCSSWPWKCSHR